MYVITNPLLAVLRFDLSARVTMYAVDSVVYQLISTQLYVYVRHVCFQSINTEEQCLSPSSLAVLHDRIYAKHD